VRKYEIARNRLIKVAERGQKGLICEDTQIMISIIMREHNETEW